MRICKECGVEKELNRFVNGKKLGLFRHKCKDCANAKRRTGKPNLGRFEKGHTRGKRFPKKNLPWNTGKAGTYSYAKSMSKHSLATQKWAKRVKERDGYKCVKCGSVKLLAAHHIIAWKDNEELRFDINNGISLCCSCHAKEEGLGIKIRPK